MKVRVFEIVALGFALIGIVGCNAGSTSSVSAASTQPSAKAVQVSEAPKDDNWDVSREVNPVTDVTTTTASLRFQGNRNLVVRQIGNKVECFVTTDEFLETLENQESRISTVQYRFDGGKVIRQGWVISANNESLFYPGNCAPFLDRLRKSNTLAFEYRPSDKVPDTITFSVAGFPDVFKVAPVSSGKTHAVKANDQAAVAALPLCSEVMKPGVTSYPTCRTN